MGYVYNPLLGAGLDQTGAGGGGSTSPGGSTTQIQFNDAGAFAGASTLTYDGSILTTSGRFINSYNATASSPAKVFTGTWFTSGGTSTTTKPHVLIEPAGTTSTAWSVFGTGFGVNAPSGFPGSLLDLQVNGSSALRVTSNSVLVPNSQFNFGPILTFGNTANLIIDSGTVRTNTNVPFGVGGADLYLARDAANTLAQRNGTNAQVFNLYNTYTSSTNFERLALKWSSNVCYLTPEKGGGGGSDRLMVPVTGATTVALLPSAATAGVGARSFVTDATATTFLSTAAGGGANKVPVVSDGTNWLIG